MSEIRPRMVRSSVGAVSVIVHNTETPTDEEWAAWIREYRAIAPKMKALLVYSLGGGPNGNQRHDLTKAFSELAVIPPAYIVTASVAVRGIVTAVQWFLPKGQKVKTYGPADLERALVDIGLTPDQRAEVTRVIKANLKLLETPGDARRAS